MEITNASQDQAQHYLNLTDGNMDDAVVLYYESDEAQDPQVITNWQEANISQFTFPEGRSACTVIACEAALALMTGTKPTKEMVESSIREGIKEYQALQKVESDSEHMSCEGVFLKSKKYVQVMDKTPYRSGETSGKDAFQSELEAALESAKVAPNGVCCAMITKPPETVIVCITAGEFVVFDSHPRQEHNINGAYTLATNDINVCASWLRNIFPFVGGLGDSMTAQMYNSFEMTLLSLKQASATNPKAVSVPEHTNYALSGQYGICRSQQGDVLEFQSKLRLQAGCSKTFSELLRNLTRIVPGTYMFLMSLLIELLRCKTHGGDQTTGYLRHIQCRAYEYRTWSEFRTSKEYIDAMNSKGMDFTVEAIQHFSNNDETQNHPAYQLLSYFCRDPVEQLEILSQVNVDSMCQQYMKQIKRILVLHAECKEYQLVGDTLYVILMSSGRI